MNEIAPGKTFWGNFEYTHSDIGQKKVVYYWTQKRSNKCKCALEFSWDKVIGVVDFENPAVVGEHTQPCAVSHNIPYLNTYAWDGKKSDIVVLGLR